MEEKNPGQWVFFIILGLSKIVRLMLQLGKYEQKDERFEKIIINRI